MLSFGDKARSFTGADRRICAIERNTFLDPKQAWVACDIEAKQRKKAIYKQHHKQLEKKEADTEKSNNPDKKNIKCPLWLVNH